MLCAGRLPWDRRHEEEEVSLLLWLLGTFLRALQCWTQEVGKLVMSQQVRKSPGG